MTNPLNPPISPRDAQRPATATDLATDDLAHRAWLDYLDDLQMRIARRIQYAAYCYVAQAAGKTNTPVATDEDEAPYDRCEWEPRRGASDHRPTFQAALDAYCAMHGVTVYRHCASSGFNRAAVYAARNCEHPIHAWQRTRLAALIDMHPDAIRWPVLTKEQAS